MKDFFHGLRLDYYLKLSLLMNQYLILMIVYFLKKEWNIILLELLYGMNLKSWIVLLWKLQCMANS